MYSQPQIHILTAGRRPALNFDCLLELAAAEPALYGIAQGLGKVGLTPKRARFHTPDNLFQSRGHASRHVNHANARTFLADALD